MSDLETTERLPPSVFEVKTHREPDGSWWVEAPGMPGLVTQGDSLEELEHNLQEAFNGWMLVSHPEHAERLGIKPTPKIELHEDVLTRLTYENGSLRNAA